MREVLKKIRTREFNSLGTRFVCSVVDTGSRSPAGGGPVPGGGTLPGTRRHPGVFFNSRGVGMNSKLKGCGKIDKIFYPPRDWYPSGRCRFFCGPWKSLPSKFSGIFIRPNLSGDSFPHIKILLCPFFRNCMPWRFILLSSFFSFFFTLATQPILIRFLFFLFNLYRQPFSTDPIVFYRN